MTNNSGQDVTQRQSIVDVFATFYEQLYNQQRRSGQDQEDTYHRDTNIDEIDNFPDAELRTTLSQLRSGRCKDESGIIPDMLKAGDAPLRQRLLQLYSDIKRSHMQPPSQWKQTAITIIHKSGDPKLPQNYRQKVYNVVIPPFTWSRVSSSCTSRVMHSRLPLCR